MEFKRKSMVNWYDVGQLASTGIKTIVSGTFGNFADRREMQAALSPDATFHDASDQEEIWIDYVSDLGDGFNPTYTVAHLLAQPTLEVDDHSLKRGDILIMGGDQVYPTPEIEEYANRLQGPYNAASPWTNKKEDTKRLFVIPGNHDWYDGLTNFLRLFCQNRAMGSWLTEQRRSYFAIKLPNCWLIGLDIQLNADIDKPQIDYFTKVAESESFNSQTKVIICTAEPAWVYKSWDDHNKSYDRIQFFINKVLKGKDCDYAEKNQDVQIATILTGDLHHYSRYEETSSQTDNIQLITAGGGGAFAHPTHSLNSKIALNGGFSATLKEVFPRETQSKNLSWHNLLFPFYSPSMTLFLGCFHLITTWFLQSSKYEGDTFMKRVSSLQIQLDNLGEYITLVIQHIKHSPSVILLNLLLLVGIVLFTDTNTGRKQWNYIAGVIHAILQLATFYVLVWLFSVININYFQMPVDSPQQVITFVAEMVIGGGLISAFIFGIYLLVSILLLKIHPTEAFSSFRWEGYKNFLRIHISQREITIYAIGIRKVVSDWKNVGSPDKPKFSTDDKIDFTLIDQPIRLKL